MLDFESRLSLILESKDDFTAAVAIVKYRQKWLLGLSTSKDDRQRKWAFPGGGIKKGEDPIKAAERECYEETGIRCKAKGPIMKLADKPKVAFVPCIFSGSSVRFNANSEFSALGFFETHEFKSLELYKNTKDLITRAKRHL